uniref:CUB and Sushi multiple domains 1 n=1 Tax=Nothobranchius furzeri TaxID=105023 RepID=A0A8C6LFC0_NOTFU
MFPVFKTASRLTPGSVLACSEYLQKRVIIYCTVHSAVIGNSIEAVNTAPSPLLSLGEFLFYAFGPAWTLFTWLIVNSSLICMMTAVTSHPALRLLSLTCRLTGFSIPAPVTSSGSIFSLRLTSDFAVSAHGFKAAYEELRSSSCGNPGVPPKGILNGTQFNVGDKIRYRCVTGYVLDGHSLLTCVTTSAGVSVWDFPVPICRAEDTCGGTLRGSSGLISSFDFPGLGSSGECKWTILADPGDTISLVFTDFQMEEKSDYLEIEGSEPTTIW